MGISWSVFSAHGSGHWDIDNLLRKRRSELGLARVGKIKFLLFFPGFWPNLGPGRRPLDSVHRDAEFAGVFASVAFLTVNFVPKSIFWDPSEKNKKVFPSKTGSNEECTDIG